MDKWEYKLIWFGLNGLKMSEFETELNKLGDDGWEVICATETSHTTRVLLKRRKNKQNVVAYLLEEDYASHHFDGLAWGRGYCFVF